MRLFPTPSGRIRNTRGYCIHRFTPFGLLPWTVPATTTLLNLYASSRHCHELVTYLEEKRFLTPPPEIVGPCSGGFQSAAFDFDPIVELWKSYTLVVGRNRRQARWWRSVRVRFRPDPERIGICYFLSRKKVRCNRAPRTADDSGGNITHSRR